jgi:hypothetical protein
MVHLALLIFFPLTNKKAALPLSRQPGYLLKTRGFPSPPYSGFGNFSDNKIIAK